MIAGLKFLGSIFLLITLLQLPFQLAERGKFPALEFPDPAFADLMDRDRIDVVQLLAAMPERGDEVGRFENPKVFCDRLPLSCLLCQPWMRSSKRLPMRRGA